MRFAIIVSEQDIAGMTIRDSLLKLFPFEKTGDIYQLDNAKLYTIKNKSYECENIDKQIQADFFIFATKHQSSSGIHSLSVHTQGNWGKAELGGKDKSLGLAPASYLREAMLKLEELGKDLHYEIIQECTHHGPHMEKPSMFIEIGSSEEEWKNTEAGNIIANTIMHLIKNKPEKCRTAFGIGGLHHTPNFRKVLGQKIALGHVCPKYNLHNLDEEMIKQAMEKTVEKVDLILLYWKGLATEKQRIVDTLDKMNLNYKRTKEF